MNGQTTGNGIILDYIPTTPAGRYLGYLEGVSVQRPSSATTEVCGRLTIREAQMEIPDSALLGLFVLGMVTIFLLLRKK